MNDGPDPHQIAEMERLRELKARREDGPDASQSLAKWALGAIMATPFLILAFGNAATSELDATVTKTEHPACSVLVQCFNAVDTDKGRLDLPSRFNGQLRKGGHYIFILENQSSDPVMYGVRGTVKSFRQVP